LAVYFAGEAATVSVVIVAFWLVVIFIITFSVASPELYTLLFLTL
jgi:hypothetical protein